MDLKQIKKIRNLKGFNTGTNVGPIKPNVDYNFNNLNSNSTLNGLNQKVGAIGWQGSTGYQNDLNSITNNHNNASYNFKPYNSNLGPDQVGSTQQSNSFGLGSLFQLLNPATNIANDIVSTINLGRKSSNEMLASGGTNYNSIMGIGYQTQNGPNENQEADDLKHETTSNAIKTTLGGAGAGLLIGGPVGAAVGGAVGLIGGLFGGGAAKRRMKRRIEEAKLKAFRMNAFNRASAMSDALDQQYNLDYSNTQDDILYANRGKDLKPLKRKKRC